MIWRVRFVVKGGHVHCSLYVAPQHDRTWAYCGDFVLRAEEFESLQGALHATFVEDPE